MSEEKFGFKGPHDPAFPMQTRDGHETFNRPIWGVTKKEYYAAIALQGLAANPNHSSPAEMAGLAVSMATHLLAALEK